VRPESLLDEDAQERYGLSMDEDEDEDERYGSSTGL
jgi:hypothetical protein